ncbi:MAG: pyruvate formate lyase family protein [Deltaproteobacteria bacterium]
MSRIATEVGFSGRKMSALERLSGIPRMASSICRFLAGKILDKEQILLKGFLDFVAAKYNFSPVLQREMMGTQGWINADIGMKSADGRVEVALLIRDGTITVKEKIPADADAVFYFQTANVVSRFLDATKNEANAMILAGKMWIDGNMTLGYYWFYLLNVILLNDEIKAYKESIKANCKSACLMAKDVSTAGRSERKKRRGELMGGEKIDPGVRSLDDPYLSEYGLDDFPRLKAFRDEYFNTTTELTAEYGKLLTDFFIEHGYEVQKNGEPWEPNLRKARSFHYVMKKRQALIRRNDLLAGTYTPNAVSGTVTHPYSVGHYLWSELRTCHARELEPYTVTEETIQTLHRHVFPFWADRNLFQLWKNEFDYPLGAKIQDRYFSVFYWKTVSQNEISPGYREFITKGLKGLEAEIDAELAGDPDADPEKRNTLKAMKIGMDAARTYTRNLASQAQREAGTEENPVRKAELERMAEALDRVPENPARNLYEAVQALWIMHICLGLESMDDGPSLGRLDQILQPYFNEDISKLSNREERKEYIKHVIEVIGCLYMRLCSHLISAPEIGTWQNSGSPPNTTIVVGGVTRKGEDAVNDMSYIILKVTEMLGLQDPNMHARYKSGVNSRAFLNRVCEVNYVTGATPCIHSDDAMFKALGANEDWEIEDIREWTPTGCVEPSIPGKHCSATSSLEVNLMAPFEMALNNGYHPLVNWQLGEETGRIQNGDFMTFEEFWTAFRKQCEFLFEQSVTGNNQLGEVHQRHLPTPLMSASIEGCIKKGRNITRGGAKYNSTGVSVIGMADVVDSLMAIKKLVFDDKSVTFTQLKDAIDNNFEGYEKLHALTKHRVPRFGSRNDAAVAMAQRVTQLVSDIYKSHKNYRGGHYATGWWTMNNHSTYGRVSSASPSGRLKGQPFTPGLTPHPSASTNMLDNLLDVAQLNPRTVDNNIAFNVRIVPSAKDTHEQTVNRMTDYVQTYFEKGGMQVQFNVVDTDTLKDAMANPEHYSDLLVRISGYCGYFVELQRDLQLEIIRRNEFGI